MTRAMNAFCTEPHEDEKPTVKIVNAHKFKYLRCTIPNTYTCNKAFPLFEFQFFLYLRLEQGSMSQR